MIRALAVLMVSLLGGACHVYQPVSSPPPKGSDVRIRLTARGALELSDMSDQARRSYTGELSAVSTDTLALSVVQARDVGNYGQSRTFRNNYIIPRSAVERIEMRTLSGWRTAALVGAGAGVVALLVQQVGSGGGGGGNGTDGGGPTAIRIPLGLSPP